MGGVKDSAESLLIEVVGNDSHYKISSQGAGNAGLNIHKRGGQVFLLLCKRLTGTGGIDRRNAFCPNVENFERKNLEEPSHENNMKTPISCRDQIGLSLCIATNSPLSFFSSVCSETENMESTESVSRVKTPLFECEKLPKSECVVKSEPEDSAEEYILQTECIIEIKKEEIAENVELEWTGGEASSELAPDDFRGACVGSGSDRCDASPMKDLNFESKNVVGPCQEIHAVTASSYKDETCLPIHIGTSSPKAHLNSVGNEARDLATYESVSLGKTPMSSYKEVHFNPDLNIVKSELDPIAKVYILETDSYIVPKEEENAENVESEWTRVELRSELPSCHFPGPVDPLPSDGAAVARHLPGSPSRASATRAADGQGHLQGRGASDDLAGAGLDPGDLNTSSPLVETSPAEKKRQLLLRSCPECGKVLRSPAGLSHHRRIHTGERYSCGLCEKTFSGKIYFQTHMRQHPSKLPYACETCGRSFARKRNLQSHLRIHTGERPHRCEDCGKTFARANDLHVHMRIHTGELPYCCDLCGNSFRHRDTLQTHLRRHTRERRYGCGECGETFVHRAQLGRHRKICAQ